VSLAPPAAPPRVAAFTAIEGPVPGVAVAEKAARVASGDDDTDDDGSSSSSSSSEAESSEAESSESESGSSGSDDDASDSASLPAPRRVAPPAAAAPAPRRAAPVASASRRAAKDSLVAVSDDDEEQAKTAPRIEYTDAASGARCAALLCPKRWRAHQVRPRVHVHKLTRLIPPSAASSCRHGCPRASSRTSARASPGCGAATPPAAAAS
jgi:hypothetical protein